MTRVSSQPSYEGGTGYAGGATPPWQRPILPPTHPEAPTPPADLVVGCATHVAIIMDGNGRWANARGLDRTAGHEAGEYALMDTLAGAVAAGVKYLSVYAFSTENWRRSPAEVRFLMGYCAKGAMSSTLGGCGFAGRDARSICGNRCFPSCARPRN